MSSNAQIETYAKQYASVLQEIAEAQERGKDLIASAKDAGLNVKLLRKVAKEMVMDFGKRQKLYEEEEQLSLFRCACGLTSVLEAVG